MKWLKYAGALLTLLTLVLSCASDIVLEPPPSLKGDYVGRYVWTYVPQQLERIQNIKWRFTDRDWFMTADSSNALDVCFCISFGTYKVEEKVRLLYQSPQPRPDTGCTGGTCDPDLSPNGSFDLRQPSDSVVLGYTSENRDTLKQILLVKAPSQ